MTTITDTLRAIERRADRAVVQELRLMTQEIQALRTQLTLEDRAHADALLLKLSHLECCQQVDSVAPSPVAPAVAPAGPGFPVLAFDSLEPLQPGSYLVHFYGHELGDLERVELTESLAAAAQLVRQHLTDRPRPVWQVTHDACDGALSFLTDDDMILASIQPCEPRMPDVEPPVAEACAALAGGDITALRRLFVAPAQARAQPLAA
ncbi:hypothetical protein [Xenophilus azovorans]|uniref:hypothetical protein n=1 Tax=Xenophilus azovorans TaxID=151755 RepID=UPI00056F47ED|nr:hypothetical protein [Xenophilus azovorans]